MHIKFFKIQIRLIPLLLIITAVFNACSRKDLWENPMPPEIATAASPGNGAWLSGTMSSINSEVTLLFSTSMDPLSIIVSGTMASESGCVWTTTLNENDTLTITPSASRTNGTGETLSIECFSTSGMPCNLTRTYNIAASVYYVKAGASGALTGTRENPMAVIQDAVDASLAAGTPGVVLVAQGVFTCSGAPPGGADYDFIADMAEGVSFYGGYSASDWDVRNPEVYVTSLRDTRVNSNINGYAHNVDDPYRVVNYTAGITQSTILDGFEIWVAPIITGASTPSACGIFIDNASPTIQNNVIRSYDLGSGDFTQIMGIRQRLGGSPVIRNNSIALGNIAGTMGCLSYGIYVNNGNPEICNNLIHAGRNHITHGIVLNNCSGGTIYDNSLIHGGISQMSSFAIRADGSEISITNNEHIYGGEGQLVYGIFLHNCTGDINGNSVIDGGIGTNSATGITLGDSSTSVTDNTLVRGGQSSNGDVIIINCSGAFSPCSITGNVLDGAVSLPVNGEAIGISAGNSSNISILNNEIRGLSSANGIVKGIEAGLNSHPKIMANYINAGNNDEAYGIYINNESTVQDLPIVNNVIDAGRGTDTTGIFIMDDCIIDIFNNTINGGGTASSIAASAIRISRTAVPDPGTLVRINNNNLFSNYTINSYGIYESNNDSYPNNVSNNNIFNCAGLYYDFDGAPVINNITDLNNLFPDGTNQATNNIAENIYSSLDRNNVYRFTGNLSSVVFDTSGLDGVALGWPFTTDYDGNTRTNGNGWSIGAFEYD